MRFYLGELQLRFFGGSRILFDGKPVPFRRRYSVALLAYLALDRQPHSRADLASLLSSSLPEPSARKLLRNALADLKQHGLGDYILIERDQISFDTSRKYSLDVDDLDAIDLLGAKAEPAALEWAAGQVGAELLAGLEQRDAEGFNNWLEGERAARRWQIVKLAIYLLTRYEREEQLDEGIRLARRLIAVAPLNEELHRRLMRMLARRGRVEEALQHYRQLDEALASDGHQPEMETADLFRQLANPGTPDHNLTPAGDSGRQIPGRDADVQAILHNLRDPSCRVVSLTGMQGSGRSSLLRLVLEKLIEPRPVLTNDPVYHGIYLIQHEPLLEASSQDQVIDMVLGHLQLPETGNELEKVPPGDQLANRKVLLALDGMEHIQEPALVVDTLLRCAPAATIMLTARTPLGVPGEWIHPVEGLRLPETVAEIEDAPASAHFLHEVRRAGAHIREADADDIIQICRLAGGHPLAISIAAGWSRIVPKAEIARQLDQGGPILSEPAISDYHRIGIQQMVEAEWELLDPDLQRAVSRLAVFRDRFDYDASLAVDVGPGMLQTLGYWSLLEYDPEAGYLLHPLMRTFGAARLADNPQEEQRIRAGAAAFYASLLDELTRSLKSTGESQTTLGRHVANLLGVWDWAVSQLDALLLSRMLPGMAAWSEMDGQHRRWADILARSSARLRAGTGTNTSPDLHQTICNLLLAETDAIQWEGEFDRAVQCLEFALGHARRLEDPRLLANIQLRQARVLHYQCKETHVLDLLQEAHVNATRTGDQRLLSNCRMMLGMVNMDFGHFPVAEEWFDKAEHTFQTLGDAEAITRIHLNLGRMSNSRGNYRRARHHLEQCVHSSQELHDRPVEAWAHAYLAHVHAAGFGQHDIARLCLDRAFVIERSMTEQMFSSFLHWVAGHEAMQSGDIARAQNNLEHSLEIGRDLASPFSIARALLGLGQLALLMESPGIAENLAGQAVQIAGDAGRQPTVAAGMITIGRAREERRQPDQAASAYRQSHAIATALDIRHLQCEAATGLVSTALTSGDTERVRCMLEPVTRYIVEEALAGCEEPAWVVGVCQKGMEHIDDPRADDVLTAGVAIAGQRLASLPVGERVRYLEASVARQNLHTNLTEAGFL